MHKIRALLEVEIGDNAYRLECSPESPLGEIHDALTKMKSFIIERMKAIDSPPIAQEKSE